MLSSIMGLEKGTVEDIQLAFPVKKKVRLGVFAIVSKLFAWYLNEITAQPIYGPTR